MARPISQKVAVAVVFVAAMFMSIMDATIVNVALPTIGRDFHVAPTDVSSVSIAFLVSLAVFIPASGWLGDRYGGKRILLIAIVLFTVASMACGLAQSMGELVLFRILQGVGGGMLTPVGMAMLFRAFPPEERLRASSILTTPTALAPAAGPVLGGLLVSDLSWRWVFFVNLPIGVAAVIFGIVFLAKDSGSPNIGRFDTLGFVLSGVGLGLLMYGISEGPVLGWDAVAVLATIAAGLVLLVCLVAYELRIPDPLIAVRLLTNRLFQTGTAVILLTFAALLGVLYVVTLFYQDGRGMSALGAGLSTFPEALGVMLGAQISSRIIYPKIGPRRAMFMGNIGLAISIALLALIGADTSLWFARLLLFAIGISLAQVIVPSQAASFATITPSDTGRASTMFNAIRQLGGALGVAAFTTVVVAVGPLRSVAGHVLPNLTAYHAAFIAAAGFALASALIALRTIDSEAAAVLRTRQVSANPETEPAPVFVEA